MSETTPENDNVFIVFEGTPMIFNKDLDAAKDRAAENAFRNEKDYTVMVVPRETLEQKTLVAHYTGVVFKTLEQVNDETP